MLVIVASFVMVIRQIYFSLDNTNLGNFEVSLTLFSGLAMLLLGATIVNMAICMFNFGKGLKEHINRIHKKKQAPDSEYQGNGDGDDKPRFVLS